MQNNLSKYALLSTLYDAQNDFIGVFSFFCLRTISGKKTILQIQESLKEEFDMAIPLDVVSTLLKRLKKKGYAEYKDRNKGAWLTEEGQKKKLEIDTAESKSKADIDELFYNIQQYFKKIGKNYSTDQIKKVLYEFLKHNMDQICLFLGDYSSTKEVRTDSEGEYKELMAGLVGYINDIESNNKKNYERLKTLVFGTLMVSTLINREVATSKFNKLEVYLDTNVIFSLLGFHNEVYNKPVVELVAIINDLNIDLKIFSITRDQIIGVLKGYLKEKDYYSRFIEVDSIYWRLKKNKYTAQSVRELIYNIDNVLEEKGVCVDYSIDFDELKLDEKDNTNLIVWKPDATPFSIEHDLKIIKAVRKKRKDKSPTVIERAKVLFLTADQKLFKYNSRQRNKESAKLAVIPEVILKDIFTSILWLKNPGLSNGATIHNIIAGVDSKIMVQDSLWKDFAYTLNELQKSGRVTEAEIDILISSEETEKMLLEYQQHRKRNVSKLIDCRIKEVRQKNKQRGDEIRSVQNENYRLKEKIIDLGNQIPYLIQEAQKEAHSKEIVVNCRKKWRRISFGFNILVFLVVVGIIYFVFKVDGIESYAVRAPLLIVLITVVCNMYFDIEKLRNYNLKRAKDQFFDKKLNQCIRNSQKKSSGIHVTEHIRDERPT
ncbi:hypothetical protein KAJ41_01905 [Candidatus Parcubacteria bacterium]|nr:hypothetical protein [Candidatus Parcubacteria bacterium]